MITNIVVFLLFLIPLDGILRLVTGSPYASLAIDALFLIMIVCGISKGVVSRQVFLLVVIVLCAVFIILGFVFGDFKSAYIRLTSFRLTGLYFFAVLIPLLNKFSAQELQRIYRALLVVGLFTSLNAIRQWVLPLPVEIAFANSAGGAAKFMGDEFQGGVNSFRVFSFFITSVHLVTFLSLVLFLSLSSYFSGYRKTWLELSSIAMSVIAILATFSRTGWLSLAIGLVFMLPLVLSRKNFLRSLAVIVVFSLVVFSVVVNNQLASSRVSTLSNLNDVSSFNSRLNLWDERYEQILDNPLGYGTGAAGWNANAEMQLGADSNYLKFFLEFGWVGGATFILLLVVVLFKLFGAYRVGVFESRGASIQAVMSVAIMSFFVACLVSMITNQILEAYPVNFMFWFFTGLGCALCKKYQS